MTTTILGYCNDNTQMFFVDGGNNRIGMGDGLSLRYSKNTNYS